MPTLIEKFGDSLRTEGLWRASARALGHLAYLHNRWIDGGFDRRWGTDTSGIIPPSQLDLPGEHAHTSNRYEPMQIPVFRRIMRDLPVSHADYAFVDFGSGKGRALLMASQYPFRRVIGVELSARLHAIAARNAAIFERRQPGAGRIELVCGDALLYPIPEGHVVCFLYNSFGRPLVARLVENIDVARRRRSRHVFVVYRNPEHADLFEGAGFLHTVAAHKAYRIYRTH